MHAFPDYLPPLIALRAFAAVAETQSFTRAGERLGFTQTAVSHQIAKLEAHVGQKLFVRNRSGATLTPAGRRLLPFVREGLATLHEGLASVASMTGKAEITVSTTPEFGSRWLAPRLEQLFRDRPDLKIGLVLEYRRVDLGAGEADVGIWLGTGGPNHDATKLGLEEEFVVSSPELAARLPRRNALKAAPLLRYKGARHTVLDWGAMARTGQSAGATRAPRRNPLTLADLEFGTEYESFDAMIDACKKSERFRARAVVSGGRRDR